jgi:hypothetical protein
MSSAALSRTETSGHTPVRRGHLSPFAIAVAVLVASLISLLFLLLSPGRSLSGIYANDLMVFYDGAHRILSGQVPNRDFHTPLGPLPYLLAAMGLKLGGSLGAMMPSATAVFAVLLSPFLLYAAASRLRLLAALIVMVFLLILTIAPVNPGDSWLAPTYAMFYNRFAWATLGTLFLFALPRSQGVGSPLLDTGCIAALVLVLFYLKISYAAVALAFTLGLLFLPHSRRVAGGALLCIAAGVLAGHLAWGGTQNYLADVRRAGQVSGALRGGLYNMVIAASSNLWQEAAYAAAIVYAAIQRVRIVYLAASLAMAACGLLLLNQNAQTMEIPVLLPAALVALLAPGREPGSQPAYGPAAVLMAGALALPATVNGALALRYVRHELAHPTRAPSDSAELNGLVAHEAPFQPGNPSSPRLVSDPQVLANAFRVGWTQTATFNVLRQIRTRQPIGQSEYLWTIEDGVEALRAHPELSGPVFTFDLANPFNAVLDRPPPTGDASWNHYGRTFDEKSFLPPEAALRTVQVIMEPKDPVEIYSTVYLKKNYQAYLDRHFRPALETTYWRIYRRVDGAR